MNIVELIQSICAIVTLIILIWNTFSIREVRHQTNSMKDELVAEVRKSAHAKGMKDQVEKEAHE